MSSNKLLEVFPNTAITKIFNRKNNSGCVIDSVVNTSRDQ